MTGFTILKDSPNKSQFPISSTINNENQIFQRNWPFKKKKKNLKWIPKESTNNKIANLSTKWVGQWGMVGYAHKNINIIFFNETKLNPTKESKSCTLVSGQPFTLNSHGLSSSGKWI